MLSSTEFIRLSLELNLFFARIAKEHSFFIEGGLTPRDKKLAKQADRFKVKFEALLAETIELANGVICPDVLMSGEIVTRFTLEAERASQFYTGIKIDSDLTETEIAMAASPGLLPILPPDLEQQVFELNERAMDLTSALIDFKTNLLQAILSCQVFSTNYPLLLDHILREAKLYLYMLGRLQNRERINSINDLPEQEVFWNRIMAEHAKFVRGLLDPSEVDLINQANNFGRQFDILTCEATAALEQTMFLPQVTAESLVATRGIRDFKAAGAQGLINCKIKAIALPLLADHILREANHYLRLLNMFGR
jgi:hypothetical protein